VIQDTSVTPVAVGAMCKSVLVQVALVAAALLLEDGDGDGDTTTIDVEITVVEADGDGVAELITDANELDGIALDEG